MKVARHETYFVKKGLFGWTQTIERTKTEAAREERNFRKKLAEMKKALGYRTLGY